MNSDIQYPEAYRLPYERVHIEIADKGSLYYCFGCDRRMIARQGEARKRRWHFAHYPGLVQCDPDRALHEAAKLRDSWKLVTHRGSCWISL